MQFENKTKPLISIAVAVYNPKEEYFRECMDSLQAQTYRNIEIILVDDGSKEDVALLCDEYAVSDSRVTVLHKENGGLPSARNMGIQMAQGEYLVFMDSDDLAAENMVEKGYEAIRQTGAEIAVWTYEAFCGNKRKECYYQGPEEILLEKGELWKYRALMLDALIFEDLQYALCMTSWGKMYKCSLLQEHLDIRFDDRLKFGAEDNDFLQRLLPVTESLVLFHENLYFYRVMEESKTSRYDPKFVNHVWDILKVLREDIQDDERLNHAYDKYCCNQVLMVCINCIFHSDNTMGFFEKRRRIINMLHIPEYAEPLTRIKKTDFPLLKYIFMFCARHHWYVGIMVLAKGYIWKSRNKL